MTSHWPKSFNTIFSPKGVPNTDPDQNSSVLGGPGDILVTDSELDGFAGGDFDSSSVTPAEISSCVNIRSAGSSSNVQSEAESGIQAQTVTVSSAHVGRASSTQNQVAVTNSTASEAGEMEGAYSISFSDLAIETKPPKYKNYRIYDQRLETYWGNWVCVHPTRKSLAEAGFFYVGDGDLVRCFYCGVGLKAWAANDDPWVEHARFSPKCPHVLCVRKPQFVSAVQKLAQASNNSAPILPEDVEKEMNTGAKRSNIAASSDEARANYDVDENQEGLCERIQQLEQDNECLRDERKCKICWVREVDVVFLTCGHLVSCGICAPALPFCPMCRMPIKAHIPVQSD